MRHVGLQSKSYFLSSLKINFLIILIIILIKLSYFNFLSLNIIIWKRKSKWKSKHSYEKPWYLAATCWKLMYNCSGKKRNHYQKYPMSFCTFQWKTRRRSEKRIDLSNYRIFNSFVTFESSDIQNHILNIYTTYSKFRQCFRIVICTLNSRTSG